MDRRTDRLAAVRDPNALAAVRRLHLVGVHGDRVGRVGVEVSARAETDRGIVVGHAAIEVTLAERVLVGCGIRLRRDATDEPVMSCTSFKRNDMADGGAGGGGSQSDGGEREEHF